jgi:nucleoid-associated protein Lsr2
MPVPLQRGKATIMARRTVIQLTDDLDGKPIPDGKGETIRFSLDRRDYEIDLGEKNAKVLRDALSKYVTAARRTTGARRGRASAGRSSAGGTQSYDPKAVRAWAQTRGIEVSQRGRVPADLVAKFQEANP